MKNNHADFVPLYLPVPLYSIIAHAAGVKVFIFWKITFLLIRGDEGSRV
jgi:hypothetical protein